MPAFHQIPKGGGLGDKGAGWLWISMLIKWVLPHCQEAPAKAAHTGCSHRRRMPVVRGRGAIKRDPIGPPDGLPFTACPGGKEDAVGRRPCAWWVMCGWARVRVMRRRWHAPWASPWLACPGVRRTASAGGSEHAWGAGGGPGRTEATAPTGKVQKH